MIPSTTAQVCSAALGSSAFVHFRRCTAELDSPAITAFIELKLFRRRRCSSTRQILVIIFTRCFSFSARTTRVDTQADTTLKLAIIRMTFGAWWRSFGLFHQDRKNTPLN